MSPMTEDVRLTTEMLDYAAAPRVFEKYASLECV